MRLEPALTKHSELGKQFRTTGHSQWGTSGLGQKFHKSDSWSPATIRHLQDHFLNADAAGKVVGRRGWVSRGHGKTAGRGPTELHHTRKLDIMADILPLLRRGEKEHTHEQKPERAWFSSEEDENTDSPLHHQTYTRNLKRMNMSTQRRPRLGEGRIRSLALVDANDYTGWISNTVLLYSQGTVLKSEDKPQWKRIFKSTCIYSDSTIYT